ncbi:MAG: hypothetical protein IJS14_09845 [Lentisphaeria bacterium]|nr:hypothetical protein [Lentisphaeria bacterium]
MDHSIEGQTVKITAAKTSFSVRCGVISDIPGLEPCGEPNQPAGLGIVRDVNLLRSGHMPWGEPALGQALPADFLFVNYFRPGTRSELKAEKEASGVAVEWRGLENGKEFLPEARLRMQFSERADGTVSVRVSGSYAGGGVFAATVPFAAVRSSGLVVPTLGGMRYAAGKPAILTFGNPPYLEAPFLGLECAPDKTLGIWMEDPTFRPHFISAARTEKGFAPVFEVNSLMPFENRTEIAAPEILFRVFPGGWKTAATPFRDYYRKQFGKETAVRDGVAWTKKIGVLTGVDARIPGDEDLEKLVSLFGREKILLMVWNARADGWDVNLPEWTPRAGYVDGVRRAQKHGIRVMCYVNICCANYASPAWKKYGMDRIFLMRKNSLFQYKTATNKTGAKASAIGNDDYGNAPDLMAGITPGKILYGDLLSPKWRKFHTDLMKRWSEETGTDAHYEDTSGTTGDHGNGIVDGLSAGEGDAAQIRLLQKELPQIPMAGEFAPGAVAFGILWPLNYPTVYGNEAFRVSRLHRQLPLTDHLYGYRQLLADNRGFSDFLKYVQGAVGDSVGGFGFISSDFIFKTPAEEIPKVKTFDGLLFRRAKLFCDKNLQKYYPEGDFPAGVVCMYQGTDGIYSFRDDGFLQTMTAPDGKAVYGRVNGTLRAETDLAPANWPFHDGKTLFGLNPSAYYALFPGRDETALFAETLPDGVFLRRYFETPDAVYLELDSDKAKTAKIDIRARSAFAECQANDEKWEPGRALETALPLRIVCFKKTEGKAFAFPLLASGQICGAPVEYGKLPDKQIKKRIMKVLEGGDIAAAIPVTVTGEHTVFEAIVQDDSEIFVHPHDGIELKLAVNGKALKKLDSTNGVEPRWIGDREARKLMFDHRPRKWSIPLGKMFPAGKRVLVTLECSSRGNTRGDRALVMYSVKDDAK